MTILRNNFSRRIYQLLTIPVQERWVGTLQAGAVVRSLYLTWVLRDLISANKNYNILDAGSGRGAPLTLTQARRYKNSHFVAVDINQEWPPKQHWGIPQNISIIKSDIIGYTPKTIFDIIICLDVLEHIENYKIVLERFNQHLKSSGKLIIHVPSINQFRYFSDNFENVDEYNLHNCGDSHVREGFSIDELQKKLKECNFECVYSRYTFGRYTWFLKEIYSKFEKKALPGIGILMLPAIWYGTKIESLVKTKKGNGILILARKL